MIFKKQIGDEFWKKDQIVKKKTKNRTLFTKSLLTDQSLLKQTELTALMKPNAYFIDKATKVIDEIAPYKETRIRNNSEEWVHEEVFEGIRVWDKLYQGGAGY